MVRIFSSAKQDPQGLKLFERRGRLLSKGSLMLGPPAWKGHAAELRHEGRSGEVQGAPDVRLDALSHDDDRQRGGPLDTLGEARRQTPSAFPVASLFSTCPSGADG
jgi:hypothetical protein